MDVEVEIHCGHCGSANYSMSGDDDSALISCNDCGTRLGDLQTLKREMLACAIAGSAEAMRAEVERLAEALPPANRPGD